MARTKELRFNRYDYYSWDGTGASTGVWWDGGNRVAARLWPRPRRLFGLLLNWWNA